MDSAKLKTPRVVLITGASSGFGRACALYLARTGYRVYGTSRSARFERPPLEVGPEESFFKVIPMDVRDAESVSNGVSHILDNEEDIDVVVNNAGFAMAGPMEEISIEEVSSQFETNVYGVIRVCQAVLPHMRSNGAGYIINISSIGGVMGLPFQGAYSASKFAIEGMSEALRIEVKPFGIHVVLIEPGDFKTGFTRNRALARRAKENSLYADRLGSTLSLMEKQEKEGMDPHQLARLVERIINTPRPRVRYTAGNLEQRLSTIYKRWASSLMFERSFMKYYKLL